MLEGSVPMQVLTYRSLCLYFSLTHSPLPPAQRVHAVKRDEGEREEREGGGREWMEGGGSEEGGTGKGGEGQVEYRLACTILTRGTGRPLGCTL